MQTMPDERIEQEAPRPFEPGDIRDVVVRSIRKFDDRRGWLAEIFRHDEMEAEYFPVMSYISATEPNVQRGPHEHVEQADFFVFIGPSDFKIRLWDNRQDSETYNHVMTLEAGAKNPQSVLVPKGVVHAYLNVGSEPGIVINCPNRLYMGEGKRAEIDEIRHEDDPATVYRMED
ncbi:MAG TPA: dTDP-4-dehydrorhamnose 3,5-epimerase family protein [Pyrinomonadaceae bacterium]|jgi:dTDP-4-dehydrorhamnose 3,5-epimerase|nr:dTDP-4-dehydrorhamnose 3,5-epimerase family protein [Pyrinomonadaceae bacterium]